MSRLARILIVTMLSMLTVLAAMALPAAAEQQPPGDDTYPVPTEPERVVDRDVVVEEADVTEVRGVAQEAAALPVTGGQVLSMVLVAVALLVGGGLLLSGRRLRRDTRSG